MPGGVRTLTLTPGLPVDRQALTATNVVEFDNSGLFAVFGRSSRPTYKFTVEVPALTQIQVQSLQAFHHFHQGGKAFFWDGCNWGYVNTLNLVGEGTGTKKDFFLPNRFIGAGSITVAVFDGTTTSITTAFSLNADPGIIAFDTAPDSGDDVLASHGHRYKVVFDGEGLKTSNWALGVYRAEIMLREILL